MKGKGAGFFYGFVTQLISAMVCFQGARQLTISCIKQRQTANSVDELAHDKILVLTLHSEYIPSASLFPHFVISYLKNFNFQCHFNYFYPL